MVRFSTAPISSSACSLGDDFLVVAYSTPVGNAAAYYPETNPLVPLDHTALKSNTPVSKAIVIRLEPAHG